MLERVIHDSLHGITLVEEDVGAINRILSRQIAESARASGMKVVFLTLVDEETLPAELPEISSTVDGEEIAKQVGERFRVREQKQSVLESLDFDMMVIDSFSSYFVDKTDGDAVELMREIEQLSKQGKSFVIVYEKGILSARANAYLHSVADNLIIVRTEIVGERVNRMLYVPKILGEEPLDKLIKITVGGSTVQEDTREFIG